MATKASTSKTTAPKAAAARPKLVAGADVAAEGAQEAKGGGIKLKELVERVAAASGAKKADVKTIVSATLAEMGAALGKGEALNLPGLGRVRVARAGAEGGGAMTLKLRQGQAGATGGKGTAKTAKEPLAEAADQD